MKAKYIFFSFLMVTANILNAANIDSLYNYFVSNFPRSNNSNIKKSSTKYNKCGFQIVSQIRLNYNKFNILQKTTIDNILSKPTTDSIVISEQKHFKIHFSTTGADKPTYSIADLAVALDSAYNYEIKYLGFQPPLGEFSDYYDIYIKNMGYYGYTEPIDNILPARSFIVINSNFSSYATEGIDAAKVTAAHEFHHAIQMYRYKVPDADTYFFEMSATTMEELVFPEINDYIQYINDAFNYTTLGITQHSGYDFAIFNLFLIKKLNTKDFIKKEWEYFRQNTAISAIDLALRDYSTGLKQEYVDFCRQCYFTGAQNPINYYFDDSKLFPSLKFKIYDFPATQQVALYQGYYSSQYFKIISASSTLANDDTVSFFLVNTDFNKANDPNQTDKTSGFSYYFSKLPTGSSVFIGSGLYTIFSATNTNDAPYFRQITLTATNNNKGYSVYPNPFRYRECNTIKFNVLSKKSLADLCITSIDGNVILKQSISIEKPGTFLWNNIVDNNQNKLASGIYFFYLDTGDNTYSGKIAVIR